MKKLILILITTILQLVNAQDIIINPPIAKKIPKIDTLHGDIRVDNYYWLRDRTNPDVIKYLEAENAYTDAMMKHTEALQESLYNEMLSRIKETDEDPPYKEGGYFYYTRTEKGKQYPIYCRKKGSLNAKEEIYLDPNEMAKPYNYFVVAAREVSPDGKLLAFTIDTSGAENYILNIKDLTSGKILRNKIPNVSDIAWASDNKTLFYTKEDAAHRPYQVYKHQIGTDISKDDLIFEETDELFTMSVERARSGKYIFINSSASNSDEWYYVPANNPNARANLIIKRTPEHEYTVYDWEDYFYIRTNKDAKTFKLVRVLVNQPDKEKWEEVIPYREGITIEGADFFKNYFVVYEREKGIQRIRVNDLIKNAHHYIEFPEPVYSVFPGTNKIYNTKIFRFNYQSLTTPPSIYDYNLETRTRILIKQQEVLGGYNPSEYQSERIFAKANDGTEIPISLVYKKGIKMDGTAPLHLNGYGAYGFSIPVTFSSTRLSLLNRGIIYAIAHVRGGGDMGREWYENGKLLKKKNTFTDFIACAEHLINEKYTSKEKLTISGGSAGGLLMGAVTTMRPDLFKAVIASVPFVDALNTMLDPTLMYTTQEYLEWGNPNEKVYYEYMKSYDPYTNVKATDYPNILVKVGFNDPRVNYWEGAKWVAKLRASKTDNNIILLKVNMGAGHAGASGRYEKLREIAFDYAYILSQYGIEK